MNRGLSDSLRCLILGSAATGLLLPSSIALGQTKNAVPSNKKKPAVTQVVEPPKLLSVPDDIGSGSISIRPVSQMEVAAAEKSDVQRELEALYQQDGREMPEINMNLMPLTPTTPQPQQSDTTNPPTAARPNQPKPTTTQKPAARPAQTYPGTTARPGANPYTQQMPQQVPAQNPAQVQRYSNLFNDTPNSPAPPAPPAVLPQSKPVTQNSKLSFFKRLTSKSKPQYNPNPVPPDMNAIPAVPPTSTANAPATAPVQQGMKYYTPSNQTSPVRPANPPAMATMNPNSIPKSPQAETQLLVTNNSVTNLPQPSVTLPPLFQSPLPVPILTPQLQSATEPSALPPLMTEAQLPVKATTDVPLPSATTAAKAAPSNGKIAFTETITESTADFPNPFPETSEAEADGRSLKLPVRREISPKSYVDDEKPKSTVMKPVKPEVAQDADSKSIDDPFAVGAKDFAEPSIGSRNASNAAQNANDEFLPPVTSNGQDSARAPIQSNQPNSTQSPVGSEAPEFDPTKLLNPPAANGAKSPQESLTPGLAPADESYKLSPPTMEEEQQLEKMRKIRERFGMKGLKGFCPVTLHDERDLVDAKAEFHATHRSQKFHFATAEARDKFEADPVKYAPAAYGADVVALSRDRDVVEGTLDFAAWFKGRLYLFGSQENYDIFIENPAKYATLNGIE